MSVCVYGVVGVCVCVCVCVCVYTCTHIYSHLNVCMCIHFIHKLSLLRDCICV